jgi:hypothetical protein
MRGAGALFRVGTYVLTCTDPRITENTARPLRPYRGAKRDPHPRWSALLERVWARDVWHLSKRLLRKVLMHTLAVLLNLDLGRQPLHLAQLVAS